MNTQIITHRGLEPSRKSFFKESSYKAFENHLKRGFGIEFDVNFTKDNKLVVIHDKNLKRISKNKDERNITDVTLRELRKYNISTFDEILSLIKKCNSELNFLHLKGGFQEKKYLELLTSKLNKHKQLHSKIIIFDVKPQTAKKLKAQIETLQLAPSVAHKKDIKRFNVFVKETLITVEEAKKQKKYFEWVWLDEWDRKSKLFYTNKTFADLKKLNYKIGLVTPELHATSPGLLAGEAHEDAKNKKVLFKRIKEILLLKPDAVCTDYPEEVRKLANKIQMRKT